jgi:acetyltransferase-like isoleucine patch superfamily enzyme
VSVFIHPQAICESPHVGDGTRIWAFAHVLPGATIGRDCNICDGVFIENEVVIGDAVTIKCGVQIWDGLRVGSGVFIGPNATFTNDIFPRSKRHLTSYPETVIEEGASVGANATVLPGLRIGTQAMIAAGAVVLQDVPARAIIAGNPGRVIGYADADKVDPLGSDLPPDVSCRLIRGGSYPDPRGRLSVLDTQALPFEPKRMFTVDQVPSGGMRGAHAHRKCQQLFVAVAGRLKVVIDDGLRAFAVELSRPDIALYVPPMVWSLQYGHSQDAVLLVLASRPYEQDDYIHDYKQFATEAEG